MIEMYWTQEDQPNRHRIYQELDDFMAVLELCVEYEILPKNWSYPGARKLKKAKVLKFMDYARDKEALT